MPAWEGLPDHKENLIHYPFQVRPGVWAFMYLPPDLTRSDVAKLEAFLTALVLEKTQPLDVGAKT